MRIQHYGTEHLGACRAALAAGFRGLQMAERDAPETFRILGPTARVIDSSPP